MPPNFTFRPPYSKGTEILHRTLANFLDSTDYPPMEKYIYIYSYPWALNTELQLPAGCLFHCFYCAYYRQQLTHAQCMSKLDGLEEI